MSPAFRVMVALIAVLVGVPTRPVLAQVVVVPAPPAAGPFGGTSQTTLDTGPGPSVDLSAPVTDLQTPDEGSASSADGGSAANPLDPSVGATTAVGQPEAASSPPAEGGRADRSSAPGSRRGGDLRPVPGAGPGPAPVPGVGLPLPGGAIGPTPQVGVSAAQSTLVNPATGAPRPRTQATSAPVAAGTTAAAASGWLRRLLPAADFWLWLLELLPLIVQALLVGLAALLSAWVLPPGGVVWRLPPELTHQFSAIGQAHAATVVLADAALAAIVALVGLGQMLGPRASLPVLPPRDFAPRLAVGVLVAHGSLAIGGWAIDLHDALLGAVTPATLAGWDPSATDVAQGGLEGMLFKLLFAVVGLLLGLAGWLRLALVDVLLVAAPVLAVLWVLPLTAHWGEWALGLFGNLLAGQWLQVLALWLGAQLLAAPSADLQAAVGRDFAALAVLLVALRLPGLLPGARGVGALSILFGAALVGRGAQSVWRAGQDRLLSDYLRRKELELDFEEVAARVPEDPRPAAVGSRRRQSPDSGGAA